MKTYAEATEWIKKKSIEYGSRNAFFASDEYSAKYFEIDQLFIQEMLNIGKRGQTAMKEVGAKVGQKVYYDIPSPFGTVETQEGIIKVDKFGLPEVKLTTGKSVKWHKGFRPLKS